MPSCFLKTAYEDIFKYKKEGAKNIIAYFGEFSYWGKKHV